MCYYFSNTLSHLLTLCRLSKEKYTFIIYRYVPSQADVAVFDALKKAPAKDTAPHAARWYAHIASFEAADRMQFPKSQKDAASYVSGGKVQVL